MDTITLLIYLALAGVGLTALVQVFRVKGKKSLGLPKLVIGIVGVGLIALALVQLGAVSQWGIQPLTAGAGAIAPTTTTGAGQTATVATSTEGQAVPIDTFTLIGKEKLSNSYTTPNGTLRFYDSVTDPKSPTASTIDTITLTAGTGSSTAKKIRTETAYRIVFDGGASMYDKDYGITTFAVKDYNKNTGQYLYDLGELSRISAIAITNESLGFNGVGTNSIDNEISGANSFVNVTYNESAGDGQFYTENVIAFNGANTEAKEPVLCFEWDTSSPPEGNEISALTTQLVSGTDYSIPSSLIDYWSKQACITLGVTRSGGVSSKVKLTVTYDEANLDATDIWNLYIDDLGGIRAKDARLNTGATFDRIIFYQIP